VKIASDGDQPQGGQMPRSSGAAERHPHPNRVMNFREWCELNGFSTFTGWRIMKAGEGPETLQLSERRIGITERANERWQKSRVR
jgi:predicted DNA-binding transcriptional regulator AlpA